MLYCSILGAYGQAPAADLADNATAGSPAAVKDSQEIQTVVVTAERRSRNLQAVPISIKALSADDLEKGGITDMVDLSKHVSGLTISKSTNFPFTFIRGVGSDIPSAGLEPSVAIYLDGVYQARPSGQLFRFVDIERIEVLKGPQGTLYGRNATGGAINIISKAPSKESEGQADITLGRFNQREIRGTFSGPLSEGVAYGRLSFMYDKDDGYVKNLLGGPNGQSHDDYALRGSLLLTLKPGLDVLLNARYSDSKVPPMIKLLGGSQIGAVPTDDPYTVRSNPGKNSAETKESSVDATIKYDMDWARLTSVTAAKDLKWHAAVPLDGGANFLNELPSPEHTTFFSQDFILASKGSGPWEWTGLMNYMHQKAKWDFGINIVPANLTLANPATVETDAFGVGGQASYSLGNGLKLTAGTRYSSEKKKVDQTAQANGAVTEAKKEEKTWTAWTPKVVAEYTPAPGMMGFVSYTKGFKSGGYGTTAIGPTLSPENVRSVEAGIKTNWLKNRVIFNASVFETKWDDMQLQRNDTDAQGNFKTTVLNAGKATTKGVDLELIGKPTSRFQMSAMASFLKAEFDKFSSIDPMKPAAGLRNQAGIQLPYAPKRQFSFTAEYTWPSAYENMDVILRGDVAYRSRVYYTTFQDLQASNEMGTIGNVQLSFEPSGKRGFYGALSIKNIGDKAVPYAMFAAPPLGYLAYYAPPRTYTAQLGYKY